MWYQQLPCLYHISERRYTFDTFFAIHLSYVHIQSKKYVIQVRTKRSSSRRSQNSILGGVKEERLPSQDSDGGATEDRCVKEIEARLQRDVQGFNNLSPFVFKWVFVNWYILIDCNSSASELLNIIHQYKQDTSKNKKFVIIYSKVIVPKFECE